MSWLKKSEKPRRLSQQLVSLGIPINVAVGPLGLSADLDPDAGSKGAWNLAADGVDLTAAADANNEEGSRIVLRDRGGGEDTHDTSQPGRSRGECRCHGSVLICDRYQL